jgi:replicative DNA helicase
MINNSETITEMSSPELERRLIGEIILDPSIIDEVRIFINNNVFTDEKCKAVYSVICEINDKGKGIDTVSVYEGIKNKGYLELVSIRDITEFLSLVSSSANFLDHCKFLLEKWMLREVITKTKNAQEKAKRGDDVFEIIHRLNEDIYQIENNITIERDRELYEELPALIKKVEDKYFERIPAGLNSTSFPSLNRATGGIMPEDFIVIYGKEKSAKTTVMKRLALDFAFQGIPIAIFTLEMSFESSAYKALSMEGNIEYLKLRNPKGQGMRPDEFEDFIQRTKKFSKTKIFIEDKTFDFNRIVGKMRILKRRHNIGLFVIDYLGLIEMARKFEARRLEIKYYSRILKNLCKELNTPIIAVSQANDNEKTAESIDPLRDCDFALRCSKPIEDGTNAQLQTVNNENYNFTEDDFLVTIERSRHGKNKQNFVCGYVNNDFKEKDLTN